MQSAYRNITAKKLDEIMDINRHNIIHKRQRHTLQQKRKKLIKHNLMLAKADKGKYMVITNKDRYHQKVYDFINENKFYDLGKDPTEQ
jgi:lipopolysaccharide/colanic/teichoic acid biosynthesis glycosyltransferase